MKITIRQVIAAGSLLSLLALGTAAFAQTDPDPAQMEMMVGLGDDVQPAPPSIGADIPVTYFGPPPSSVQRELIGPYQLLKSGTIDIDAGTVTLPLYEGRLASGESVWYVLTDTNDRDNADALGLNFSAKLAYAGVGNAVRNGTLEPDGTLVFERGAVDFSPERAVTPGEAPNFFPPAAYQPGSVGDEFYTPLVRITNTGDFVYNAPVLAFNTSAEQLNAFCEGDVDHSLVHDRVVRICPEDQTVTVNLVTGFSFARPVFYVSFESNNDLAATLEASTFTPALSDIGIGRDDSFASAVERLFVTINGPMGTDNPQRQGLNSVLAGEAGSPLNVFGGIPTIATDYSPLWDMNLIEWTQTAVDNGYRSRLFEEFNILGLAQNGWITGPGGADFGSTGIIVNCPVVYRFL